jgi:serine/threonine protein kinase/WD40 repeat protein
MSESGSDVNPLDALAEEFVARHRRGERPSLDEFIARRPDLADDIRDLFPGLVVMEGVRPGRGDVTGPFDSAAAGPALKRLGDYRILREVGRGGMGLVYEAEQESLGRHVALKVLPAHALLDSQRLRRFQREAKAAARLHHTNIVPVYGVGESDGLHYYVMQFIQGLGLDQVFSELRKLRQTPAAAVGAGAPDSAPTPSRATDSAAGAAQSLLTGRFEMTAPADSDAAPDPGGSSSARLPGQAEGAPPSRSRRDYWRSVARVGVQVADALAYAHGQGVLHRDVKPSNLLIDAKGNVWVTDFGLAKAQDGEDLTHTGDIVGTLRYMAPECFNGKADARSDVYSLGLTLYELLTLRPAFAGKDRNQLLQQVLNGDPPRPRSVDRDVPRDMETVVLKAIARDPGHRYQNPAELADDLRRFVDDRPVRARRAGMVEQLWRWRRRNPAVAGLLATVMALLAAVAVVSASWAMSLKTALGQKEVAEGDARRAEGDARRAEGDARRAEGEARRGEAEALVGQAHGTRLSRLPGQRFEALAALCKAADLGRALGEPPEWFDRLRNEAIAALALPDIHITQTWDGFPPDTHGAAVSQDLELYARTTRQGDCSVRRIADDGEIAQLPALGEPAHAIFGPGRLLMLCGESSGRSVLWDLGGPEPVPRLVERGVHGPKGSPFRPDGRLLLLDFHDGSMRVYATDTGSCKYRLAPKGIAGDLEAQLHPTDPIVAVCSYFSGLLQVRDLRTEAVLVESKLPWNHSGMCAWSPDGRTLGVSDGESSCRVALFAFDPAGPSLRLTRTLQGHEGGGNSVCFNPAGDRIITIGWDSVVHLFDAGNGRLLFFTPAINPVQALQFDASGERLAAARVGPQRQQIGVWSVADAREYRALVPNGGQRGPHRDFLHAVHPGGRLAAMRLEGVLVLFDLETGRELASLPMRGAAGACFDAGGNLIADGPDGLFRWPVRPDPAEPGRLTVGPPERLPFQGGLRSVATSRDGRVVAQASFVGQAKPNAGGWVLSPNSSDPHAAILRRLEPSRCEWVSVSPDGRWVAFGPFHHGVNVYETETGRRVWQSADASPGYCRFSADGGWLLTDSDGGRAWSVDAWQPGPPLGPGIPWDVSPDGRLVVVGQADGVYRLVELASGRELARLEDPDRIAGPALFTPDGACLVVSADDGLRVWDLRRIRQGLARLGLDWDALPYPEAAEQNPQSPLEVKVAQAPAVLNDIAWRLLTGPKDQRDAARALQLSREAVDQEPENVLFLNTLGIAQYRADRYADAVVALEKSLQADNGKYDAFNLFFLAMCHAKLGAPDKAQDCYDRAVKWWGATKDLSSQRTAELTAFQAEAKAVLGLK